MSFESISHNSTTPPLGNFPVLDIDGNYYVTLPPPDGLEVGNLMITVGAAASPDAQIITGPGYTPVDSTGWVKRFIETGIGGIWVCTKVADEADVALSSMKFGPVVDALDASAIAWLRYDGTDVRSVAAGTLYQARNSTGPSTLPAASVENNGISDGVAVTVFAINTYDDSPVTAHDSDERVTFEPWVLNLPSGLPRIVVVDETVAAGDTAAANLSDIPLPEIGHVFSSNVLTLMLTSNQPPNTPTVALPRAGSTYTTIEDIPVVLSGFVDPDPADAASLCQIRYRLGAGAWTTATVNVDGTGTIPALATTGTYGVEGQYTDQDGATSDWSMERTFTVIDPPPTPVVTAPVDDATIPAPTGTLTWTVTNQDKWQARLVADDGGDPDPTTIYWDSGLVDASGTRSTTAHYPTNEVLAHMQLRVFYDGHYSAWDDVPVDVEWTKPDAPVITGITESDNDAAIQVDYTTDVDSIPSDATSCNVWASADDFLTEFLIGTLLAINGSFVWHLPASQVGYSFEVEAVNAYGATNRSDPDGSTTATARDLRDTIIIAGGAFPE